MQANITWLLIISDLFVNLAAGWFGGVFIVPNFSKKKGSERLLVLISNLAAGILCLLIAFELRIIR